MSPKAAGLAKENGYNNIKVLLEGEPAWSKEGYPTYASSGFVSKGNIVLIDLRSVEKSEKARVPRSVTIPYDTLDDRISDIPKKAPIVLYSDNEGEALKALQNLQKEGFGKVSLVYGNLDQLLKAEGNSESGPVVTEIKWQRKLGEGEISVADFEMAAAGKSPDVLILDVRTKEEAAAGKFPSSVNIPLDELPARAAELPMDETIYIHCSTGARAEMAYKQLAKDGHKAFFLVADVECNEKQECDIED
jgi:rhodanese-related sulfurtransferase